MESGDDQLLSLLHCHSSGMFSSDASVQKHVLDLSPITSVCCVHFFFWRAFLPQYRNQDSAKISEKFLCLALVTNYLGHILVPFLTVHGVSIIFFLLDVVWFSETYSHSVVQASHELAT